MTNPQHSSTCARNRDFGLDNDCDCRKMADTGLKDCPFCGGEAHLQPMQGNNPKPYDWHVFHHCGKGSIRLQGFLTKEDAITSWNTRVGDEK